MGVFEWHGLHWAHTRHEGSQETCHCRGSLIVAVVVAGRSESKGAQVYSWLQCDLGSLQFVRRSNTIPAMAGSGWRDAQGARLALDLQCPERPRAPVFAMGGRRVHDR